MRVFGCLLVCFVLIGCVDEFDYSSEDKVKRLVIWGEVNTDPGPYKVNISKTVRIRSDIFYEKNEIVNGATVFIVDDLGNRFSLKQLEEGGKYLTEDNSFRGQVGRSYHLMVKTPDGKTYYSQPEKIPAPAEIQSVSSRYLEKDSLNKYGLIQKKNGHLVVATINDPINERNYYRWSWNGTMHLRIKHPEYVCSKIECIHCPFVPCSREGYRDEIPYKGFLSIGSDLLSNGTSFAVPIGFVEEVFPRFSGSPYYYFNVKQQSITADYFKFLEKVSFQLQAGGTVDPPPTTIYGNLFCEDDANEEVLGYFSAVSNTSKSHFIVANRGIPADSMTCLLFLPDVYCEKPDYWTKD